VEEKVKIMKSKSPPKSMSVLKEAKRPAIIKLKASKKINYRKIEKIEEKSPLKKKSLGKKSSCDMNEPKNLYLA
jgi:hypothetical protein